MVRVERRNWSFDLRGTGLGKRERDRKEAPCPKQGARSNRRQDIGFRWAVWHVYLRLPLPEASPTSNYRRSAWIRLQASSRSEVLVSVRDAERRPEPERRPLHDGDAFAFQQLGD